jgi:hypothetical protein
LARFEIFDFKDYFKDGNFDPGFFMLTGDIMNDTEEASALKTCLINTEDIQTKLDMRAFQLKTLNDVSKELFKSVDAETIIKNFLLMTMGNVGVLKGFVLLTHLDSKKSDYFVSVGFQEADIKPLRGDCKKCVWHGQVHQEAVDREAWRCSHVTPHGVEHVFPFLVEKSFQGILGLGPRLAASTFDPAEKELLETLINNLVIALKNAQSFEKIMTLNQDLHEKNVMLEKTLEDLKTAVHKVDLLESIKESLSKFVPLTVTNMIESSPTGRLPESKKQDPEMGVIIMSNLAKTFLYRLKEARQEVKIHFKTLFKVMRY